MYYVFTTPRSTKFAQAAAIFKRKVSRGLKRALLRKNTISGCVRGATVAVAEAAAAAEAEAVEAEAAGMSSHRGRREDAARRRLHRAAATSPLAAFRLTA